MAFIALDARRQTCATGTLEGLSGMIGPSEVQ